MGEPFLVAPPTKLCLRNIDEQGRFIENEVFMLKGEGKVRQKNNHMKAWRKLIDQVHEEMKIVMSHFEVSAHVEAPGIL